VICARYAIIFLVKLAKIVQVIECTKPLGRAIHGIQNAKGKAKAYQVKQVLKAIEKIGD